MHIYVYVLIPFSSYSNQVKHVQRWDREEIKKNQLFDNRELITYKAILTSVGSYHIYYSYVSDYGHLKYIIKPSTVFKL